MTLPSVRAASRREGQYMLQHKFVRRFVRAATINGWTVLRGRERESGWPLRCIDGGLYLFLLPSIVELTFLEAIDELLRPGLKAGVTPESGEGADEGSKEPGAITSPTPFLPHPLLAPVRAHPSSPGLRAQWRRTSAG